jgi:hypothetical protein
VEQKTCGRGAIRDENAAFAYAWFQIFSRLTRLDFTFFLAATAACFGFRVLETVFGVGCLNELI